MWAFQLNLYQSEWAQTVENLIIETDTHETARLQGKLQGLRRAVDLPYSLLDKEEATDGRGRSETRRTG